MNALLLSVALFLPTADPAKTPPEGVLPFGADGKPLNFDFETGTLKDWTAEGEAFKDQPIKGDFNGNNVDEIAVYRHGQWYVQNELGQLSLVVWGVFGDIPVPADYDGDGTTDYAIFRPTTGEWWIINSGFTLGFATQYVTQQQWGLNGDIPVPGDYDGDGRDDMAVFRPTDGNWYIRYAKDGTTAAVAWGHGYFGDIPFRGLDMNGDGKSDLVVYRPSVGHWYINHLNGGWAFRVHGNSSFGLPANYK